MSIQILSEKTNKYCIEINSGTDPRLLSFCGKKSGILLILNFNNSIVRQSIFIPIIIPGGGSLQFSWIRGIRARQLTFTVSTGKSTTCSMIPAIDPEKKNEWLGSIDGGGGLGGVENTDFWNELVILSLFNAFFVV